MRLSNYLLFSCFLFLSCSDKEEDPNPQQGEVTDIPEIDALAENYMSKYSVPGMQVAISKHGKLVYAKSFGKADVSAGEDVKNTSLFRIASVSKPVTGIAVMKLVEDGKLKLSDKVFGSDGILGTTYGHVNAAVASITVEQLLKHTSGGWGNSVNDPMFSNPQMTANQLISWTLANRPLSSTPGTRYDYSNFGYCVLGRVIEKVTGDSYEGYVKSAILQPAGITQMTISANRLQDRKPHEVVYYGQNNENPYGPNVSRMDAHGGWIASATDLVRLLVRVDGFSSPSDLLSTQTISLMTTGSGVNPGYANGWSINSAGNWWHTGSMPGTTSLFVRTSGGYCWAISCNTRINAPQFNQEMDELIWKAVNNPSIKWPAKDLF